MEIKSKRQATQMGFDHSSLLHYDNSSEHTTYQTDKQHLYKILPSEIWVIVLRNLENDSESVRNSGNSSIFFRQLQTSQLAKHLFPHIIEVLVIENERSYTETPNKTTVEDNSISDKVWRNTVLSCRLVCSLWNKSVNTCYKNLLLNKSTNFQNHTNELLRCNPVSIDWVKEHFQKSEDKRPEDFLFYFEESHIIETSAFSRNPFLGRHLSIHLDDADLEDSDLVYYGAITRVLTLFGQHIWYCEIHLVDNCKKLCKIYYYLQKYLNLMPNLRSLHISGICGVGQIKTKLFRLYPLPTLEKLRKLNLENLPEPLAGEIILRHINVPIVDFSYISGMDQKNMQKKSKLARFGSSAGDYMIEQFGANWNLQRLSISQLQTLMATNVSQFFEIMENNWSETLTELKLENLFTFNCATVLNDSKSLRLNLPLVSRLSINMKDTFFLDFILPMRNNLKHLVIVCPEPNLSCDGNRSQVMRKQTIEFVGFEERMNESNIWKIFSKLKTFKVAYNVCKVRQKLKQFIVYTKETKIYYQENKRL